MADIGDLFDPVPVLGPVPAPIPDPVPVLEPDPDPVLDPDHDLGPPPLNNAVFRNLFFFSMLLAMGSTAMTAFIVYEYGPHSPDLSTMRTISYFLLFFAAVMLSL
ncbi:hypothetical protein [Candidatus Ichthyocystis sparus]|nr:hypothetical protein [Candidatus Ichthyocystis sparus]